MVARLSERDPRPVLLIALGGALGSSLRYSLGATAGEAFLVTIGVNGLGSFGLGLLLFDRRADDLLSKRFRYLFGTGFFASFTTYSTFTADIVSLGGLAAIAYILASYLAGTVGILGSRWLLDIGSTNGVRPVEHGDS